MDIWQHILARSANFDRAYVFAFEKSQEGVVRDREGREVGLQGVAH